MSRAAANFLKQLRYARLKAAGLCTQCGKEPTTKSRCDVCRGKDNDRLRNKRQQLKLYRMCRDHPQIPAATNRAYCADCLAGNVERNRCLRARYKGRGMCYCGRLPLPGRSRCGFCAGIASESQNRVRKRGLLPAR